ncbi:MAG: Rieske 2Fe-2S domain-containing protein [SAR324 cluster bacterium]|jgi:nitrite reductase/ring-hydroxylating ferredoxin subunit/alkylhydroperoxidase/carboxymuconolactone decarboxylase family protein YurZ|nr:carboxymuconolactone decarboxylase [Deltaproteobacteria bacterium]MDP6091020.1 Rieske 2Fe-2S domain-containing protein [SAR324 cluster bacterium]MDP6245788.1 Rieske 2Fe-2S domain-containing protein [SAR324 cluster bacterium]MDP6463531.1 Rieske 2Fe-2S domain-containing protein [SAR324 cluster bacterium]MDP6638122.1 Rieske 2Fe-2S domain-containing protein [SAR324 cluster bacterium]|tara:strand:- start:3008 stop:3634 length:627 start_codon:yes stop_codon:yes gene_type:complete
MSDALNYLVKTRPDAMGSYFSFLKKAGEHLDTRSRDLISVITKVAVQTEPGLRQYLSRALRNGCSADEILDALLMAFPVLGLAKIIWAIEIILEMDIPEFRVDGLNIESVWHTVAPLKEIPLEEPLNFTVDDRSVFVYRTQEEIRIFDSRCPHQVTNIPHLALEGTQLTCPKHQWTFDIRNGECLANGRLPLKRFESREEKGQVQAFW